MKLSEAIRVAEKAKAWLDRMPEYRAAIDALQTAARAQDADPKPEPSPSTFDRIMRDLRSEVSSAWSEFAEGIVGPDLPPCEPDAARPTSGTDALDRLLAREELLRGVQRTAFEEGWSQARVHYGTQTPDSDREFHGAECDKRVNSTTHLCTCNDAEATDEAHRAALYQYPDPRPVPPKPGDEVPDHEAASKLPEGTLIKSKLTGRRALIVKSRSYPDSGPENTVRWAQDQPEYPATIVDVNVP